MFKEIVLVSCGRREDREAHQRSLQEPGDREAHDVQPGLSPRISPSRNERECAFCKPDGPASEDKRDLLIVPPQGTLGIADCRVDYCRNHMAGRSARATDVDE
jgi:hypothetical protein